MRPYKVLLFIACVMACLAALCLVLPHHIAIGEKEVRWPTLAEVLEREEAYPQPLPEEEESIIDPDTIVPSPDTIVSEKSAEKPKPVIPKVAVDSTTDSRQFLSSFYAALQESGERKVRVMHYGDSQIEEDRMTMQIREQLQKQYGGRGVGLMPLLQTIPTRTTRQELRMNGRLIGPSQAQQGPKRYLVYGFKRDQREDGMYGAMGQVAWMNDSLVSGSEDLIAMCKPQSASAHYDEWRIFADTSIRYTTSGDTVHLMGRGAVYGLSQESRTGVIVDNIPMRGCLGMVFTKMDSAQLRDFYRSENVRLIILQFGGNAIPSNEKPETIRGFVQGYRDQIHFLRKCAPDADILFIGPSDMMRLVDGEWQTYPMVPYMDRLLRKMAMEEEIAYFSLYQWMGGAGSMLRWQETGLAGSDGVHFYRSGARKAGNAVVSWLLEPITNDQLPMTNHQ